MFYSNSKAETIINESDTDLFESIYSRIISNIQKTLENVLAVLLIQSSLTLLLFQSTIP